MNRKKTVYICQQCGYQSQTFLGRCPECGSWSSLVETIETRSTINKKSTRKKVTSIVNLKDIKQQDYTRLSTNLSEFDRVLGGGIVPGALILLAGDPGIGKSTLLSQLSLKIPNTLYVAGEESPQQIKLRLNRLQSDIDLMVLPETDVDAVVEVIESQRPTLVIIDSIQTLYTQDLSSPAGSVGQVRESTQRLQQVGKRLHIPIFLVGHINKEGAVAGPKILEHIVDAVLAFEGDPTTNFRILRGLKNRFGPTDEVGIFEMSESGLVEVSNPSMLFLNDKVKAPGSAITVITSGLRAIVIELQALVTKTIFPLPKRNAAGIDSNRLQLLVAVLTQRLRIPLYNYDIFVNVTGGLRITEPACDLAICLAIISAYKNQQLPEKSAFIAEVGLLGELRSVRFLDKRIQEAQKLGFKQIISAKDYASLPEVLREVLK